MNIDTILCNLMDGRRVTEDERQAVAASVRARLEAGEQGDDLPIAMSALGCDYDAACNVISQGDGMAAVRMMDSILGKDGTATYMVQGAESAIEKRMHQALKDSWKYVNTPFVSNSAKSKVGGFVNAESVAGQKIGMLFAIQTAWPFVHDSGGLALKNELRTLLGHGAQTGAYYGFVESNSGDAEIMEPYHVECSEYDHKRAGFFVKIPSEFFQEFISEFPPLAEQLFFREDHNGHRVVSQLSQQELRTEKAYLEWLIHGPQNDGRLTADSSMYLDFYFDQLEEIEARIPQNTTTSKSPAVSRPSLGF
ncbi:hypothetical protein [Vogesella sp. XCS3]|uniref:hypothetical protein n=1 Tax=Vogesella sp. XCS3 TaxID=2877939 RepID=UPI001D0AB242|nr:hypothetical protein [Vogesella sp. XCS3]UDM18844.1 hypothetical protein LCH97_18410 [Vogesella sp. XCS3]